MWELISENPFLKVSKFPENKGRTRFLTKEELQSLLEECKKSSNGNLYGMVLLGGTLGMRFSEITNLTWKDIDFTNRFITLEMTKNKDSLDHIVGRFNSHLQNSFIIFANEAIWDGNKKEIGALKALISDPTIFIEGKGKDGFQNEGG